MNPKEILEKQKENYSSSIADNQAKLREYERAYESLRVFKGVAERSQGSFVQGNQEKDKSLSALRSRTENSLCAKRYYVGMGLIISGIGTKIIGLAFSGLITACAMKLRNYMSKISECESAISGAESKLQLISEALDALEG